MTSLLQKRAEESKSKKALALLTGQTEIKLPNSDNDNIAIKLQRALKTAEDHELEDTPRQTVLRMLIERQIEELFTFKVSLGLGGKYVQAMRMVLSRARGRAKSEKKQLDEFKLYEVSITSEADHDVVVLMRSKRMTKEQESVYDKITELFEKQPLSKKK